MAAEQTPNLREVVRFHPGVRARPMGRGSALQAAALGFDSPRVHCWVDLDKALTHQPGISAPARRPGAGGLGKRAGISLRATVAQLVGIEVVPVRFRTWAPRECRSTARTAVFQTADEGSTPFARTTRSKCCGGTRACHARGAGSIPADRTVQQQLRAATVRYAHPAFLTRCPEDDGGCNPPRASLILARVSSE